MEIMINGTKENIADNTNLLQFLISKQINPHTVVVEHNLNIVKNSEWSNIVLKENDTLEVLRFVGGG